MESERDLARKHLFQARPALEPKSVPVLVRWLKKPGRVISTEIDAYKPERRLGDALYLPESGAAFQRLVAQGWTDALLSCGLIISY